MSDNYEYDDDYEFEDEQPNGPKALREQVKKLQSQLQAKDKELGKLRSSLTDRNVTDVLAGKNFKNPDRVKKAILADGVDATDPSAVQTWLQENGDDYAKAAPASEGSEDEPATSVDPEVVDAHQKLDVQGGPSGLGDAADKFALVQSKITPDMRGEDVERLYREHGI